ncbi:hypothetical protein SAMN05444583_10876 [Rhodococcus maanshanensis]|uniref:PH domain-containing protein n=2 Tax=Rhodococcus maanshanensis TaxID=183556 RepID=A0A1H7PK67_9NOCA|nr:hypothetical protein SAMN05444583_10876 [Rhodococcus maanshanensis]
MQFSRALEVPSEWPAARYTMTEKLAMAMMTGFGLIAVLVGLAGWAGGFPAALRYSLGIACLFFLIVATGVAVRDSNHRDGDIRTVAVGGIPATELRQSRRVWVLLVALMTCLTALSLGAAIEIYLKVPSSFVPGAAMVFGLFGIFLATFLVVVSARLLRPGYIQLTRDGIRHRGWSFESYLPWEAVAGAKAAYNGYRMVLVIGYANAAWERRYTTSVWRIDRLPPVPMIEVDCRKFAIDEALMFHLVTHYANNADARAELGTEAAVGRARTRDYPEAA